MLIIIPLLLSDNTDDLSRGRVFIQGLFFYSLPLGRRRAKQAGLCIAQLPSTSGRERSIMLKKINEACLGVERNAMAIAVIIAFGSMVGAAVSAVYAPALLNTPVWELGHGVPLAILIAGGIVLAAMMLRGAWLRNKV